MQTVTFPRVLESLGDKAFYDCSAPIAVDLSNTEITKIVGKSFYNCTALKTLKFPNTLENLNNQDFANCSLLNQHWFVEHKSWIYFRRKFLLLCVFERGEVARKSYRNCAEYIQTCPSLTSVTFAETSGWAMQKKIAISMRLICKTRALQKNF